ncbi:MAG: T9SS type A sorting domain-containing protein [Bacteroidetes bacterium]|nr:T9SS type A sorting domain-containing protein [Bacteroidota bacterium]
MAVRMPTYYVDGKLVQIGTWIVRCTLVVILLVDGIQAQNFVNTGKFQNNGTFRVRNAVSGLPDTIGGTFEYFGETQVIQATTYNNLRLTTPNPSVKTTASGSVTVLSTATVARDVTYQLHQNAQLTLSTEAGRLTEEGFVIGRIRKTVVLSAQSDSTDFGGIGAQLRYSGNPLGVVEVIRTAGTSPIGNALQRSYHISPTVDTRINGALTFTYSTIDVPPGVRSEHLELWRSIDGGITWRRQRTENDITNKRLVRKNWYIQGIWTAADSANLIGPANYEGDPDVLIVQADSLRGRVGSVLSPFTVQVTDIFGQPVPSTKLKIRVIQVPNEATGYAIMNTNGEQLPDSTLYSDQNGIVSLRLKLGSKRGVYKVQLRVDSLTTVSKELIGYADAGVASIASIGEATVDSVKSVVPLTIEARDEAHLSVPDVKVNFELVSWPGGSTKHSIIAMDTVTNAAGRAQAILKLGEKVGAYTVKVTSPELDSSLTYTVIAVHGAPVLALQRGMSVAADTIGAIQGTFTYAITDIDTNAVPNRDLTVRFVSKPVGTVGDSILFSTARTNAQGEFHFAVKLGTKIGSYIVSVSDPAIHGSEKLYTVMALPGMPVLSVPSVSTTTDTIGAKIQPLALTVMDRGLNPIAGIPVRFTLSSIPVGAEGAKIHDTLGVTDSVGFVSTMVTLGNKVGQYAVRITSERISWLTHDIALIAIPGVPSTMLALHGTMQKKEILQPLDTLFTVQLTDRAMNPIQNDTVFFTIREVPEHAEGYSLDRLFAITDNNGIAAARLTVGNKVGLYRVYAFSSREPSVYYKFEARALPGAARYVASREGNNQVRPILTVLDTAFVVLVSDRGENPVPSVPVRFHVTRTPRSAYGYGLGAPAKVDTVIITDSAGVASIRFTLGSKIGEYEVVAAAPVSDTVRFISYATVGAPHALRKIAGEQQVGQIGDQLLPFVVRLQDVGENDIVGKTVHFSIVEKPQYAYGDSLSNGIDITDSLGMASTQLTLGLRGGTYKVRAMSEGIDTIFTAHALIVLADVNNDNYQNIGDITAMIDHILGRRYLTGAAFIKADIKPTYPDGSYGDNVVDIYDLVAAIDSIQAGRWNPVRDAIRHYQQTLQKNVLAKVSGEQKSLTTMTNVGSSFQITHIATRFVLNNDVPIKGIQAILYLNRSLQLDTVDLVFNRAKMMNIDVKSEGNQVRILVYNMNNTPLEPDSGALFRFPVKLLSPADIDSMHVLVSVDTNIAAMVPYNTQDITAYIPAEWMLYQNYPNPFNPTTTIEFDVPEVVGKLPRVAIQIFNILGQKVRTLEPGVRDVGRYRVVWNGRDDGNRPVASGVYFYRLLAGEYVSTKKMILLK